MNKFDPHSDYEALVFVTKWKAKGVLDRLTTVLAKYKIVTIADLYEVIGSEVVSKYPADHRYGWDDLSEAKVIPVPDGYSLRIPYLHDFTIN